MNEKQSSWRRQMIKPDNLPLDPDAETFDTQYDKLEAATRNIPTVSTLTR